MASYNKVILIGNLTRDPELRYTPKGLAIAKIGLAVNRTWRDANGESKEETTFVDIDAFGKLAETLGQYMKKGRPLMVEGRLRLDTWEDKQTNQKRSRLGVILESFQFLDFRGGDDSNSGAPRSKPSSAPAAAVAAPPPPEADEPPPSEDDVPF
jgi:single-strand DNA-binding protein